MTQVAPLPAAMNNSLYGANNNNSEERETGSGFEVGLYLNITYRDCLADPRTVYTT